ncbi:MAG: FecR family protein [Bacteroidales bacterium]|jgi:ferric-dicitrate binding protein FerR (iron transport regulator)|nr:FecR family protein [Bacteroidales bacterium]
MQTKENKQSPDDLVPGYLKGELTADETKELIIWIKSDSVNKRYFDEYCEIWITAKASQKNYVYNFNEGFWKFKQKIKTGEDLSIGLNKISLFKTLTRYAAIFIVAFSLSGLLFYYIGKNRVINPKQSFSELIVPMGSRAQFSLSDGTAVTLNAGSRLKYDNRFGIEDRVVQLEGEGYFKVAKDSKKPFTVKTSQLNIMALGTTFNIKAYSEDKTIETTLIEGSIKIEQITDKSRPEVMVLKPNQKLTFFKGDSTMVDETAIKKGKTENNTRPLQVQKSISIPRLVTENVNVEPVISWKENRWIFEKQSLSWIAVELERRFDVQIHFESERLKTFRFTGTIIAEPIEQVLEVMSITAPINFKLKGRVVTLSENKNFEEFNKSLYNQNN